MRGIQERVIGGQVPMEFTKSIVIKETRATIRTSSQRHIDIGIAALSRNRAQLESYLSHNRSFLEALSPIDVAEDSPEIVLRMTAATKKFGVGPMASVAGALADLCLEEMLVKGARFGMVENGGEIAASGFKNLLVAIFAGSSSLSNRIGLQLTGLDLPIGIGTSSATVSHAKSFGEADAAVAVCDNACLADAAATAIGNKVTGKDPEESIHSALGEASKFLDLRGALIIRGDWIGTWGRLPRLLKISQSFRKDADSLFSQRKRRSNTVVKRLEPTE